MDANSRKPNVSHITPFVCHLVAENIHDKVGKFGSCKHDI